MTHAVLKYNSSISHTWKQHVYSLNVNEWTEKSDKEINAGQHIFSSGKFKKEWVYELLTQERVNHKTCILISEWFYSLIDIPVKYRRLTEKKWLMFPVSNSDGSECAIKRFLCHLHIFSSYCAGALYGDNTWHNWAVYPAHLGVEFRMQLVTVHYNRIHKVAVYVVKCEVNAQSPRTITGVWWSMRDRVCKNVIKYIVTRDSSKHYANRNFPILLCAKLH